MTRFAPATGRVGRLRPGPVTLPNPGHAPEALIFRGAAIGFDHVAVPGVMLEAGDLLVEVELATVCGSDRHTATGKREGEAPLVLGHEQVGRIVALGPGEPARTIDGRALEMGDRVVWSVALACKTCYRCTRGMTNKCERLRKYGHTRIGRGWELNGGFATHVHVLSGSDIALVPDHIPAEVLAPASCATATVVAAIEAAGGDLDGRIVVVSGCGMLGLTAISMARLAGAIVIGVDPDPARQAQAIQFGAVEACAPGVEPLQTAISSAVAKLPALAGATKFDVAFEMSGSNAAVTTMFDLADVGASIVLVGHVFPVPSIPIDPELIVRNLLTITGVHNYRGEHLLRAVEFLEQSDYGAFAALVGETVPLEHAMTALVTAPVNGTRTGIRPHP